MLAVERANMIMEILQRQGSALVTELSKQLNVTEETIRKDLGMLEKQQKLKRVHGGAYITKELETEAPAKLRKQLCIAQACMQYIEDGDTIFLDRSTTACQIAQHIRTSGKKITVITNSLDVLTELSGCEAVNLISSGGTLRHSSDSFYGPSALNALSGYYATKAFVSCSGMSENFGISDFIESEAEIRKVMLQNAAYKYLIADHLKFSRTAPFLIQNFDSLNMVFTGEEISNEWHSFFSSKQIEVVIAGKTSAV